MTLSLYDAVIPSNLQILKAVDALLDKAETFCGDQGIASEALIDARLATDMLPFGYQVKSCAEHSVGAIAGVRRGSYAPDLKPWATDFAALHAKLRDAMAELQAIDREDLDSLADADTEFHFGGTVIPFTGANFLLSFSQPNFYFHATTAYAILRAKGVAIGKPDFIGMPRIKR